MARPTSGQKYILNQLRNFRKSSQSVPLNCLVYGPPGSGKRTVVRCFAESIGLRFLEVNVGDAATSVCRRLFGTRAEAERAADLGSAPGDCATDEATLLYLSGFENLHPSLHQEIHRLVTNRLYVDAVGCRWSLSDDTWLFGALQTTVGLANSKLLGLEHWLCTSFQNSIRIDVCQQEDAIWDVCGSIAEEFGLELETGIDAMFSRIVCRTPGRLHAVRRWITNATLTTDAADVIRLGDLKTQMLNDISLILEQLPYRGRIVSLEEFEQWAEQFGNWKMCAYHIVRWIADSYYISVADYYKGISHIIQRFNIQKRSNVIFPKWQTEGKSAPRLAHQMKNQAYLRTVDNCQVDFTRKPLSFSGLDPRREYLLVIVDDFAGSGRTLETLFDGLEAPVPTLLNALPKARLFIGVIAGYRSALQKVMERTLNYSNRIQLVPYRVFDKEDRCFSSNSRIFPDIEEREGFRKFCIEVANRYFRGLEGENRIGFDGVASLVVFADTVPNNSLPILWYDNSRWRPLFPASGLPGSRDL